MKFGVAFQQFWVNYFRFKGRATRSEFWWPMLPILVTLYATSAVALAFQGATFSAGPAIAVGFAIANSVVFVSTIVPVVSSAARRMHDSNFSAKRLFLYLIPFLGPIVVIILLAQQSDPHGQKYD